jgi:hypothetical protein
LEGGSGGGGEGEKEGLWDVSRIDNIHVWKCQMKPIIFTTKRASAVFITLIPERAGQQ